MITVTLCCALGPRQTFETLLEVPTGCTLREAVRLSALQTQYPNVDLDAFTPGIWGRARDWEQTLVADDRIELCRPLLVDPKVARRERFQKQGSRSTGLFAKRRPGSKAGY